jgi:hypothetical protein
MGEFEILGVLCTLAFVLAVIAVVGHGLWLLAAAFLRLFDASPAASRGTGKPCARCGSLAGVQNGRCASCGAVPAVAPGDTVRAELLATARQLRRMLDQGRISKLQYDYLAVRVQEDLARFGGALPPPTPEPPMPAVGDAVVEAQVIDAVSPPTEASAASPVTASPFGSPVARQPDAAAVVPESIQTHGSAGASPSQAVASPSQAVASPSQAVAAPSPMVAAPPQANAEPPQPARSLADMLQSFMEESNIRWGEILAALLIVVSSVGLVFSLRATLKSIPYFPALLFMLFTVAFHGAGMYTLRRWKIQAVSRVVLIISLLLVPLAVSGAVLMSGSGGEQREVTDPLFLLALAIGAAVFAWVSWSASRELVSAGAGLLAAGVLGCSLSQVIVQRVELPQAGFWIVNLVAAIPLACFLLATVGQLARARRWKQLSRKRAGELFLALGVATFALAAPLTLLFIRAEPRWLTASWLSPILSLAAATVLALGLVVHRRATSRDLAAVQTAGTSVLILGGFLLFLLVFFAWPEPELLCAVGVVNAVILISLALAARLPLLHAPAIACIALAAVMGLHLAQGRFDDRTGLGMQIVEASLMARSSLVLTLLAAVTAAIGVWQRRKEREEWPVFLSSSGALGCLGIAIAAVAGFISIETWQQDADLAGPILLVYAIGLIAIGPRTPWPAVAPVGSCLLWAGLVQVTTFNGAIRGALASLALLPDRSIFVATLAHAVVTGLVAAGVVGRRIVAPRDEFRDFQQTALGQRLVLPLAALAAVALVAVFPAIFWVWNDRFGWHTAYALWAAAAWAAIALAQRWKWAVSGMQVMLVLAPAFLVAERWHADVGLHWLLAPGHVHGQLLLLPCAAILWSLVRRLSGGNELARDLLEAPWPSVDHLLIVRAAVIVPVLAFAASLGDLGWELGFDPTPGTSGRPANPLLALQGRGFWLLAAMIVALLVSLWEHITRGALVTLGIVTFTAVWLAAQFWHEASAVASAARWSAGIYAVFWALPFIFRGAIAAMARRLSWLRWKSWSGTLWRSQAAAEPGTPEWTYSAAIWFCAQPLVLGGLTVLVLTIIAVIQNAGGVALRGPAIGSIFHKMGPTASYAVPLLALVGVLLAYAVRERQAGFALAGSAVFQLAINLAFILHVTLSPLSLPNEVRAIEWFQWNAAAAGAYALIWIGLGRWIMPAIDRSRSDWLTGAWALVAVQIVVGSVLALVLVVWASASVVANPRVFSQETAQLGQWLSYAATGCVLAALGWLLAQRVRRGWADIVAWLAAACIAFVACSADQYDVGRTWLSYHILTGGWLTIGAIATVLVCTIAGTKPGPGESPQFAPHHLTAAALAALVTFLAIRGTGAFADPGQPWWTLAATAGPLIIAAALGIARRSQLYAYASVLLAGLTVIVFVAAPQVAPWWHLVFGSGPPLALVDLVGVAMVLAASFWLALEIRAQSQRNESLSPLFRGPRVHAATLLGWLGVLVLYHALLFLPFHWWKTLGDRVIAATMVAVLGATLLGAAWDRRAIWWIAAVYVWGCVAWTLGTNLTADHFDFDLAPRLALWLLAVAGQVAITGQLWSYGANLSLLGTRLGVSDPIGGLKRTEVWLPPLNLALAGVVCLGQLWLVLTLDRLELRVAAAWSPAVAGWGVLCLAQEKRRDALQVVSLLMAGLTAVYLGWAQLDPAEAGQTWALTRAFRLLMVLSAVTFIYGLVVPRWLLTAGSWNAATRQAGYLAGAAAIATFVAVLGLEATIFTPGVDAPIDGVQVGAIAVVLFGLIAGLVSLAILPGRDPLALSETGRQWYVYAAEATGALLFAHLYICRPTWFDTALRPYWPLIIMGIAFIGVGASELCHRLRIRVLAEPLERTGGLLPILPALGWWIVSSRTDYALLLFVAGALYLVLSVTRRSWAAMTGAAIAGNGALWALLNDHGLDLTSNPQFWLIPPALSVLAAAQINKNRLPPATLAAIRYAATIAIYLSSTSEIFIRGVGTSLWPPMILASLSVAGVMVGIMLRIRAFLYLGTSFTLLALITMVWHAARAIEHVWPWWAFGIGLGIAILVLFGVFEKKRPEMLALITRLRQWEQ